MEDLLMTADDQVKDFLFEILSSASDLFPSLLRPNS